MAVMTWYSITWNDTEESSTPVDGNPTTYQVTGLTPDTTYSFTVSAENDCNMASQGATTSATTEGACFGDLTWYQLHIPEKLRPVSSLMWC